MNMMPFLFHDDVDILEYVSYHDKSGKVSDTEFFWDDIKLCHWVPKVKIVKFGQNCVIWSKLNLVPVLTIFLRKKIIGN